MKTALVTGSSRGIGRAIAIRLAQDGYKVIVHYAGNAAKAMETRALIEEQGGIVEVIGANLCDLSQTRQLAAALKDIDVLVLNASVQYRSHWQEISLEACYDQVTELKEAGIEVDETLVEACNSFRLEPVYEGTRRLLERRADLTAIFALSDSMAIAAIKALHDSGRRVPEDCSVTAIDGIEMTAYTLPTLTTMVQPQTELGTTAVETLVDMIEGRSGNRHIVLPATPRMGGSVVANRA